MGWKIAIKVASRLRLKRVKCLLLPLVLLGGMVAGNVGAGPVKAQTQPPTLFKNVRVFDGEQVALQTDVLVRDGIIREVGRDV